MSNLICIELGSVNPELLPCGKNLFELPYGWNLADGDGVALSFSPAKKRIVTVAYDKRTFVKDGVNLSDYIMVEYPTASLGPSILIYPEDFDMYLYVDKLSLPDDVYLVMGEATLQALESFSVEAFPLPSDKRALTLEDGRIIAHFGRMRDVLGKVWGSIVVKLKHDAEEYENIFDCGAMFGRVCGAMGGQMILQHGPQNFNAGLNNLGYNISKDNLRQAIISNLCDILDLTPQGMTIDESGNLVGGE